MLSGRIKADQAERLVRNRIPRVNLRLNLLGSTTSNLYQNFALVGGIWAVMTCISPKQADGDGPAP